MSRSPEEPRPIYLTINKINYSVNPNEVIIDQLRDISRASRKTLKEVIEVVRAVGLEVPS
jgi:hypothetical protein